MGLLHTKGVKSHFYYLKLFSIQHIYSLSKITPLKRLRMIYDFSPNPPSTFSRFMLYFSRSILSRLMDAHSELAGPAHSMPAQWEIDLETEEAKA